MKRIVLAFLAGQALTALLFITGGHSAGFIAGASLTLLPIALYARRVAHLLNALADAANAFHATWRPTVKAPGAGPRLVNREARIRREIANHTPAAALSSVQRDVISALVNQGLTPKAARERVTAIGDAADFETLFRKAVA